MRTVIAARLAWSICALCVAGTIAGIVLAILNGHGHLRDAAMARAGAVPLAPTLPLGAVGSLGCGVVSFIPAFYGQLDSVFLAGASVNTG